MALIDELIAAKHQLTIAHYENDGSQFMQLAGKDVAYITISDLGMRSIPPLLPKDYESLCGDDIDIDRCMMGIFAFDTTLNHQRLYKESFERNMFRGMAYRCENLIKSIAPDRILIQQGSEPLSKILYSKAHKLNVPALLVETSFLPEKYLLDAVGMHFFPDKNMIDSLALKQSALLPEQKAQLDSYIFEWRESKTSKYLQPTDRSELKSIKDSGKKVLFIPGQIATDASILNSSPAFPSFQAMLSYVSDTLSNEWIVIYKPHPLDSEAALEAGWSRKNVQVIKNAGVHDIFALSTAVLTISSNVGLEALIYGLPVLCAGMPHYSRKGLTLDIQSQLDFRKRLQESESFQPPQDLLDRFLYYVIFKYLIAKGDHAALDSRLNEASNTLITDARAPFCENYPVCASQYLKLSEMYTFSLDNGWDPKQTLREFAELPEAKGFYSPDQLKLFERDDPPSPSKSYILQYAENQENQIQILKAILANPYHAFVEKLANIKRRFKK